MITPEELHELDFWDIPLIQGNYLNLSHIPAIILIPNGQGYIPYVWDFPQHTWRPYKMITTREELISLL